MASLTKLLRPFKLLVISALLLMQSFAYAGTHIETDELLAYLQNNVELTAADAPMLSIIGSEQCHQIEGPLNEVNLNKVCEMAQANEVCQSVEPDQRLTCRNYNEERSFNTTDLVVGCIKGLFDSVIDLVKFLWSIIKGLYNFIADPGEAIGEAAAYADSIRLYLVNEYDKAYDEANRPFRKFKAAKAVSGVILSTIANGFMEYVEGEYQSLGCMNFEARTRKVCNLAANFFVPPAGAALLILRTMKRMDTAFDATTLARRTRSGGPELDEEIRIPGDGPPAAVSPPQNGFDLFREAYNNNRFNESNRYITYLDNENRPINAKVEGFDANGYLVVLREDGTRFTVPKPFLRDIQVTESSRRVFTSPPYVRFQLNANTGNAAMDNFRQAFNDRQFYQGQQYISIELNSGARVPAKITSYGEDFIEVIDENGLRKRLTQQELQSARFSSTSRQTFEALENLRLPPSQDANINLFREAFNRNTFDDNNRFISYQMDGERLGVRIVGREGNFLKVENADGYSYLLSEAELRTARVSDTARQHFLNNVSVAGIQRTQPPSIVLSQSPEPAVNNFRAQFNQGQFVGDQRYVSVMEGNTRRPARVVDVHPDSVVVEYVDADLVLRRTEIFGQDLNQIRSSPLSAQTFHQRLDELKALSSQDVRGVAVSGYEQRGFAIDLNLQSPGLRRWVGESQRMIREQLGITPDMHPLSPEQQRRLQEFWINQIRPKLESRELSTNRSYGTDRADLASRNSGRADLGQVIEEGKAVCLELSMFASTLFSQYGIRSKLAIGHLNTNRPDPGMHGYHAWLNIYDERGNIIGVVDSNNTQRVHPDPQDYVRHFDGVRLEREIELIRPQ